MKIKLLMIIILLLVILCQSMTRQLELFYSNKIQLMTLISKTSYNNSYTAIFSSKGPGQPFFSQTPVTVYMNPPGQTKCSCRRPLRRVMTCVAQHSVMCHSIVIGCYCFLSNQRPEKQTCIVHCRVRSSNGVVKMAVTMRCNVNISTIKDP